MGLTHEYSVPEHRISAAQRSAARSRDGRAFRVVRIVLGLLLVTAAGLKLYGLNVGALPRIGWFSQPILQIAASTWEFSLGIWLLSGTRLRQARLASIFTFLVFAQVTLKLAIKGASDCGCLGSIPAHPWAVFIADFFIVIALCLAGAANGKSQMVRSHARRMGLKSPLLQSALLAAFLLTGAALFGVVRFGTLQAALQRFLGYDVTLDAGYVDFGTAEPGTTVIRAISIRNWTEGPIHIVGMPRNCLLSVRTELPLSIPSGEARAVELVMLLPLRLPDGTLTFETTLWTDSKNAPALAFRIGCHVRNHEIPAADGAQRMTDPT